MDDIPPSPLPAAHTTKTSAPCATTPDISYRIVHTCANRSKDLNLPNLFLFSSALTFTVALLLGASLQLTMVHFITLSIITAAAIILYIKQFMGGLKGSRNLTVSYLKNMREVKQQLAGVGSEAPVAA